MCASRSDAGKAATLSNAISFAAATSCFMATFHAVVFRTSFQYLLGYEFTEYSDVFSSGANLMHSGNKIGTFSA